MILKFDIDKYFDDHQNFPSMIDENTMRTDNTLIKKELSNEADYNIPYIGDLNDITKVIIVKNKQKTISIKIGKVIYERCFLYEEMKKIDYFKAMIDFEEKKNKEIKDGECIKLCDIPMFDKLDAQAGLLFIKYLNGYRYGLEGVNIKEILKFYELFDYLCMTDLIKEMITCDKTNWIYFKYIHENNKKFADELMNYLLKTHENNIDTLISFINEKYSPSASDYIANALYQKGIVDIYMPP